MKSGCIPGRSSPEKPNEFVREIHTRLPVIIPEEYQHAWLSGGAGKEIVVRFRKTE
jgi:putative SOS response-associated peptidase YedK